jgi:hypothetical protein
MFAFTLTTQAWNQDWNWRWSNSCTSKVSDVMFENIFVDFKNNIYVTVPYIGAVYFGDTSLISNGSSKGVNYALARYSASGDFIDAMRFYGYTLWDLNGITSKSLDIYVGGEFNQFMQIHDSMIYMANGSDPFFPEVFLAKLSPNYEIKWVGLISDPNDDDFIGLAISEQEDIYISTYHYANQGTYMVNYFDQVISEPFNTPMSTIVKLDTNLNIQWIKEIRSEYLGTQSLKLFIGDDNLIYLYGNAYAHFYVDEDTIYHPSFGGGGEAESIPFLLSFNNEGELQEGYFIDWDLWFFELEVDNNSNLCIAGTIQDTAVIGQDTIIVPDGFYYSVVGKFDQTLTPIWYEIAEGNQSQGIGFSQVELIDQNLITSGYGKGNVQVSDTSFSLGNYYAGVICEFDSAGSLLNLKTTNCVNDLFIWDLLIDNCNNPIICGYFKNKAIFGNDTLLAYSNNFGDGFISKIDRVTQGTVELGPDTLACAEYTIYGPLGYMYYSWNNTITNQNWFTATETETYNFACSNEDGCWLCDTINIAIHPGFDIDLGPDTAILENENIVFIVPDQYESYLWSNSVTANSITIFGDSYEPGTIIQVWVQVTDVPCIVSDTVYITIKSEFAIDNIGDETIKIFPNPFKDYIAIESNPELKQIEIIDLNGTTVINKEVNFTINQATVINAENLLNGVYFLKLKFKNEAIIKKIVKL